MSPAGGGVGSAAYRALETVGVCLAVGEGARWGKPGEGGQVGGTEALAT